MSSISSKQARLAKNKERLAHAQRTENKDGSLTTTIKKDSKGTSTLQLLTTQKSDFTKASKLKLEEFRTTGKHSTSTRLDVETDHLGRLSSSQSEYTREQRSDGFTAQSKRVSVDAYGNSKVTTGHSEGVQKGEQLISSGSSTTKGALGTSSKTSEQESETFTGKSVVALVMGRGKKGDRLATTTSKSTTGTDFTVNSDQQFRNGTLTLRDSADWEKKSFNKELVKEKQLQLKDAERLDNGFSQANLKSKLDKVQVAADLLSAAGLQKTVLDGKRFDTTNKPESFATPNSEFVGSRVGVRGEGNLTVGVNGVEGRFRREAVAGQYAEKSHEVERKHGKTGYQAQAKAEAKATFDTSGKLNLNGLDVRVGARAGAVAESSVKGTLETKPAMLANVALTVGVEGSMRGAAEASAEASGAVRITRNPPVAIAQGKLGASAVVKAEVDVKTFAGPFAVRASGYASAGAEATASGVIGYQDGKLKLSASLGAALGVGLGGSAAVEVDVKQIGQLAKNTADVNGDGKLGLDDVRATAQIARSAVSRAASNTRAWLAW